RPLAAARRRPRSGSRIVDREGPPGAQPLAVGRWQRGTGGRREQMEVAIRPPPTGPNQARRPLQRGQAQAKMTVPPRPTRFLLERRVSPDTAETAAAAHPETSGRRLAYWCLQQATPTA